MLLRYSSTSPQRLATKKILGGRDIESPPFQPQLSLYHKVGICTIVFSLIICSIGCNSCPVDEVDLNLYRISDEDFRYEGIYYIDDAVSGTVHNILDMIWKSVYLKFQPK